MALRRVNPNGENTKLEMTTEEYRLVARALVRAFNHALTVGASADIDHYSQLIRSLRDTENFTPADEPVGWPSRPNNGWPLTDA